MVLGLKPMGSTNRIAGRQRQGGAIDWFLIGVASKALLVASLRDNSSSMRSSEVNFPSLILFLFTV